MMLSISEAEWVVVFEAAKEVKLMIKLLQSMKISVKHLVTIRLDNVRAISMVGNMIATRHNKHMDISYKYVNEYAENEIDKIVFLKSAENDSGTLTNNCIRKTQRR